MEEILDLYEEPYDELNPIICFDERPYQLLDDAYPRLTVKPGKMEKQDHEYVRKGRCNLFVFFQPHTGWRHVKVTKRRTAKDVAECMKEIVDEFFPKAIKIRLIQDNLNVHSPASLYERFSAADARNIKRKLDYHYTPIHASWLNMVEIEIGVLAKQCLDRRIADMDTLKKEIAVWEKKRNEKKGIRSIFRGLSSKFS